MPSDSANTMPGISFHRNVDNDSYDGDVIASYNSGFGADSESEIVERDPTGRYGRYTEVLGRGACKTVYKAFDEMDGIEVAWNQVKIPDISQKQEDLDRLCSEVHLLKTLKHKNIIKFYHSWLDMKAKNINFITEIFTSGTLRQYRKRHKRVDMRAVKNWSRQILRGLLYLHSHDPPIIHRDLKCDNIFVNGSQGEVKIGDLGLATILQQAHVAHSVLGTPEFMAPELYEEEYTELVDIYSFGMCLLEMVTFEYPYSECANTAQIYKKVTSGKKPDALNKVKDPEVCQFIEKCIASASERLPARELLTDPFLQSFDHKEGIDYALPKSQREDTISVKGLSILSDDSSRGGCGSLPPNLDMGLDQDSEFPVTEEEEMLPLRSVDFKVKGQRREDDTVYLRLKFAQSQGHVRNIHFPFDIEVDTAMSVASEMVAELELADQDVTKIAEMIDAAILDLVPEWKPGVSIEETCDSTTTTITEEEEEDIHSRNLELLSSEVLSMDPSHPPSLWADSLEGAVHGRFEEVLSDASDSVRDADYWDQTEGLSSGSSSSRLASTVNSSFLLDCECAAEAIHPNDSPKEMWTNIGPGRPCEVEIGEHHLLEEEEKLLSLKHEQELKELQGRHQKDMLELRKKWEERRNLSSLSSLSSSTSLNEHLKGSSSRDIADNVCLSH